MDRKLQVMFVSATLVIAMLACQRLAGISPSPEIPPTATSAVPTLTAAPEGSTISLPFDFLADPNTACAIYKGEGLACLDKAGWHTYELKNLETIIQCPDGRIYLGAREQRPGPDYGTYVKFYALAERALFKEVGHETNSHTVFVDDIACGTGNELWVSYGAGTGFTHFDGVAWTDYNKNPEGLYTNNSVDIVIAPNGNLWVAIDGSTMMGKAGSLVAFDGTEWQSVRELSCESVLIPFTQSYARSCPGFSGVAVDENGNVWVGGPDGLEKYDGVEWTTFPDAEQFGGRVLFYKEGRVWMLYKTAIWTFDTRMETWDLQIELGALSEEYPRELQFDPQGRVWLLADDEFYVYDDSTWVRLGLEATGPFGDWVDAIVVFGDGPVLQSRP